jgi:hypothetical protein
MVILLEILRETGRTAMVSAMVGRQRPCPDSNRSAARGRIIGVFRGVDGKYYIALS